MTERLLQPLYGTPWVDQNGQINATATEFWDRLVSVVRQPTYPDGEGPILTAPDGGLWRLGVDNSGNLTTTSV